MNQRKITFLIAVVLMVVLIGGSSLLGAINAQNRQIQEAASTAEYESTLLSLQIAAQPTTLAPTVPAPTLSSTGALALSWTPSATLSPAPTQTRLPSMTYTSSRTPRPTSTITPTPTQTPTGTITPSLTVTPSTTLTPSRTVSPTNTPTPIPGAPTPVAALSTNGYDIFNVLLIGMDEPATSKLYRTDSLIIVSVNRTTNTVTMLSIPRDLYIYIPGVGTDRINTATVWGEMRKVGSGIDLLIQTIRYNLGIDIQRFARVDFAGFQKLVDYVDGIDIAVDCELTDKFRDDYHWKTVKMGVTHMDGEVPFSSSMLGLSAFRVLVVGGV